MSSHRSPRCRAVAIGGVALLLALVAVGCGRNDRGADAANAAPDTVGSETAAFALNAVSPGALAPSWAFTSAATQAPAESQAPVTTPQPTAAPLATPDLTDIEQLLDDVDAALGADATADTDEGSAN